MDLLLHASYHIVDFPIMYLMVRILCIKSMAINVDFRIAITLHVILYNVLAQWKSAFLTSRRLVVLFHCALTWITQQFCSLFLIKCFLYRFISMVRYFWIHCFILSLERQKWSLNKNFVISRETIASIKDILSIIQVLSLERKKWNCLKRDNNACVIYCLYRDNFSRQ